MNIHTAENYEAAQQIIKALALPTASGAPVAPRPLPLSHLPRLPSETSMGSSRACRSCWEGHEPRNHRCLALGVRPAKLVAAPAMVEFPLIANYIPLVEKAVTNGTRRVYGPYCARVVRESGYRRVNEPTALEISQLAEQVRAGAVQRRNAGEAAGRRASDRRAPGPPLPRDPDHQPGPRRHHRERRPVRHRCPRRRTRSPRPRSRTVRPEPARRLLRPTQPPGHRRPPDPRSRPAARRRTGPTAPRPSTAPRPGRPSPPGHSVLQSVRQTGRWSLSKRPANPYRTVADSAAARCLHRGGWAVSERYPRSGDSEFTPAGKPFVTRAHGPLWSTRFAGQIRLTSLGPRHPGSGKWGDPIRIGSVQPGNGDHVRSRKYTATAGVWPGHGRIATPPRCSESRAPSPRPPRLPRTPQSCEVCAIN